MRAPGLPPWRCFFCGGRKKRFVSLHVSQLILMSSQEWLKPSLSKAQHRRGSFLYLFTRTHFMTVHPHLPTPPLLSPFINIHWQPLCRAAPVEVFNTGKQTSQTYAYCSSSARAFWLLCTGNTSPVFPGTQKPFLLSGTTELQIRMSTSAREQYVHCFCSLKDGHVCAYVNL